MILTVNMTSIMFITTDMRTGDLARQAELSNERRNVTVDREENNVIPSRLSYFSSTLPSPRRRSYTEEASVPLRG